MSRIPSPAVWYATRDYRKLLPQPGPGVFYERRCRLLAAACARRVSHLITLPQSHAAIEAAERSAELISSDPEAAACVVNAAWDGRLTLNHPESVRRLHTFLQDAHAYQQSVGCRAGDRAAMWAANPSPWYGFVQVANAVAVLLSRGDRESVREQKALICDLVRDVFEPPTGSGSPRVGVRPANAIALAERMYACRDFSDMPALGAALADAGCSDANVLAHCHADRPHVRGCWVADQLLGKTSH